MPPYDACDPSHHHMPPEADVTMEERRAADRMQETPLGLAAQKLHDAIDDFNAGDNGYFCCLCLADEYDGTEGIVHSENCPIRDYRQCLTDQAANTEALRALGAVSWADPPEVAQSAVGGGLPLVALTDEQILHCCDEHTGHQNKGPGCIAAAQLAQDQGVVDRMLQQIAAEAMAHEDTKAAIGSLVAAAQELSDYILEDEGYDTVVHVLTDRLEQQLRALSQVPSMEEQHGS